SSLQHAGGAVDHPNGRMRSALPMGCLELPTGRVGSNRSPGGGGSMATRTYGGSTASTRAEEARGAGWLGFAAIMLGIAGIWNIIDGALALGSSKIYGVNTTYVFSDLRTWGWIVLLLGALQAFAAFAIFSGSEFA